MTPTASLTDPQYRLVAVLEAWSRDRPGEVPSNREIAELCGWSSISKVRKVLAELEALGVLARGLEDDGRQVRRTSIRLTEAPGRNPDHPRPRSRLPPSNTGSSACGPG
jgi:hypothetical protein